MDPFSREFPRSEPTSTNRDGEKKSGNIFNKLFSKKSSSPNQSTDAGPSTRQRSVSTNAKPIEPTTTVPFRPYASFNENNSYFKSPSRINGIITQTSVQKPYKTTSTSGLRTNTQTATSAQRNMAQSLPGIPDSRYKMNHPKRGRVAIFVHQDFNKKNMKREGATIDVSRLMANLPKLGFLPTDISIYHDYAADRIRKTVKNLSEENHTDKDCFMLFVLTHGSSKDIVHARDDAYSIEELWTPFLGNRCKSLIGKPKIFFIVACRGDKADSGVTIKKSGLTAQDAQRLEKEVTFTIPSQADVLTVYSTTPGHYSYRELDRGTWYIEAFCRELAELKAGTVINFTEFLTAVNRKLATAYISVSPADIKFHDKKQCSSYTSTLIKNLYFTINN